MAAPKNNQFWKLRSKHGRDKLFATPELMWEAACEYFQWCVDNPLERAEVIKSGNKAGSMFKVPVLRAFSMEGLCNYLDCGSEYFRQFKRNLKPKDKDFSRVITRIEEVVSCQQYEGAAANLLNANIVARKLGLTDKTESKTDITTNGESLNKMPEWFDKKDEQGKS